MGFLALQHAPNQVEDHTKHMTPEQKAAFAHHVQGLSGMQHFDVGGTVGDTTKGFYGDPIPVAQKLTAPIASANGNGMGAGMAQPGQAPNTGQTGGGLYAQNPGWLGNIHNSLTSVLFGAPNQFQAQGANLQQGYNQGQIDQSLAQTQSGLGQQQQFNDQLAGVNGVGNQQSTYNQLQGVANGTGPNPAMAALAQQTGNNVSNQAALMAGQRGASANAGMIARQAGQQGAALQQQGVGQAATLQAQQSMNALGQMGQIAGQQVGAQQQGLSSYNQAAQGQSGQLLNAQNSFNQNQVGMQSNLNNVNSGVATNNQNKDGGIFGGIGSLFHAQGGMIKGYADGGDVGGPSLGVDTSMPSAPPLPFQSPNGQSATANYFNDTAPSSASIGANQVNQAAQTPSWMQALSQNKKNGGGTLGGIMSLAALFNQGGNVNPLDGEAYAQSGSEVPGHAAVAGNSLSNDKVPAMLSPGEIIVPRDHASDPQRAAQFAYAVAMRNQKKGGQQ